MRLRPEATGVKHFNVYFYDLLFSYQVQAQQLQQDNYDAKLQGRR